MRPRAERGSSRRDAETQRLVGGRRTTKSEERRTPRGILRAAATVVLALALQPATAGAVYECGGEYDTCVCGRDNYCLCDGTCGNCVWHAWHSACCHWGRALEWCTDANTWDDYAVSNGYPTGDAPRDGCIFVCEPSGTCSEWGHVGWVVTAHADGSFDSTEQSWGGPCGTFSRTRAAGFATGGFIYNPDEPPPPTDADGDGYPAGADCDDGNPDVHPDATEACNGRDDDCDGSTDEGCPTDAGTDTTPDVPAEDGESDAGDVPPADAVDATAPDDAADVPRSDGPRFDTGGETGEPADGGGDGGCGCGVARRTGSAGALGLLLIAALVLRRGRP